MSKDALGIALEHAVEALGLPAGLSQGRRHLALPADLAAARLHAAFERTESVRAYLCPLDGAGELPDLSFGPNRIVKFTAAELENTIDAARLERTNKDWTFDSQRFSQFTWLVIRQSYAQDRSPQERALPWVFRTFGGDYGAIEPHRRRFPEPIETALFAISLAPWEDWVDAPEVYWRAFDVPWFYQVDDDIFVRRRAPPSPDSLTWGPPITDHADKPVWGTGVPECTPLNGGEVSALYSLNDSRWKQISCALQTALFETPIVHFCVKAFLEPERIDEFLAHLLTIEAALGLRSDYPGATKKVAGRVSKLLRNEDDRKYYCHLFNIRSTFLHGRRMEMIPSKERVAARRLARRVVNELVSAAIQHHAPARSGYLTSLHP